MGNAVRAMGNAVRAMGNAEYELSTMLRAMENAARVICAARYG